MISKCAVNAYNRSWPLFYFGASKCGGHVGNFRAEFTLEKKNRSTSTTNVSRVNYRTTSLRKFRTAIQRFVLPPFVGPMSIQRDFKERKCFLPPIPRSVQKPKRYFRFRRSGGKFEFTSCVWLCPNFQLWKFVHN